MFSWMVHWQTIMFGIRELSVLISIHSCRNEHVMTLKLAENCNENYLAESTCMVYINVLRNDLPGIQTEGLKCLHTF